MADFNATLNALRVSRLFLKANRPRGMSGMQIAKELGFSPFTTYSILRRMENIELVKSSLEQFGAPPQRLYRMTDAGRQAFASMLGSLQLSTAAA